MEYNQNDLESIDAELSAVERRRSWMAETVLALRARDYAAEAAARQEAVFASKVLAMRNLRASIEMSIAGERKKLLNEDG
ncbi:MAG: hypothetical protein EOP21_10885 [Hyphomicrobiales bacterium]|nr:MAG: hypothetical protein EOP21_10885 [Hyphomicrobiales bacterium]